MIAKRVIIAKSGEFNKDFEDFKDIIGYQPVGVIQRDFADSVSNAISFRDITNQNRIGYFPTGSNSNSYTSTFIQSLTGVRPKADSIFTAPGESFGVPDARLNYSPSPLISNTNVAPTTGSSFYDGFGLPASPNGSFQDLSGGIGFGAAAGGFLIYPNKSNTNQVRAIYSK